MTELEYKSKVVVILAGYANHMNSLMRITPGLPRRFPGITEVPDWTAAQAVSKFHFDIKSSKLELCAAAEAALTPSMQRLVVAGGWASAGTVDIFVAAVKEARQHRRNNKAVRQLPPEERERAISVKIEVEDTQKALKKVLAAQAIEDASADAHAEQLRKLMEDSLKAAAASRYQSSSSRVRPPQMAAATLSATEKRHRTKKGEAKADDGDGANDDSEARHHAGDEDPSAVLKVARGAGVGAAEWEQFQRVKGEWAKKQLQAIADRERLLREAEAAKTAAEELELQMLAAPFQTLDEAAKEASRQRKLALEREKARVAAELRKVEREKERQRQIQLRLQQSGTRPAGDSWIPDGNGVRCAGGSHFMSGEQ
jgi:hypothetical protein